MNDVPVLDKEMSTTGKNLSDSIVEKYAFVFQSCDVNMKLLWRIKSRIILLQMYY